MCAKILVDDEISIRKMLFDLLERERYYVELASSTEEALEKIKETTFDLIISDIKMPGMDGLSRYDGVKFVNFTGGSGLVSNEVWCIHEDKERNLGIWYTQKNRRNLG